MLVLALLTGSATVAFASLDVCSGIQSCDVCTNNTACGWCNGTAFDKSGGVRAKCLPIDTPESWVCAGAFKNFGQCHCKGTKVPVELAYPWRGFYVDGSVPGEVAWAFENVGEQGRLSVLHKSGGGKARAGNVSFFKDCPTDGIQVSFDDGGKMACSYRANWQAGGDAWTLSFGCNPTASFPADFDKGASSVELYTCSDHYHCDFGRTAATEVVEVVEAVVAPSSEVTTNTDVCETHGTCAECNAGPGCAWCLGHLEKDGVKLHGQGHCFGQGQPAHSRCLGLTLEKDCVVHKCKWDEYFKPNGGSPDCKALSGSCDAPTTADDPDFSRHNTPASAYVDAEKCHENCVDPTMGCGTVNGSAACVRTHTCDPHSNCASCDALVETMQGIEISKGWGSGLTTFKFTTSADKGTYTAVDVITPAGATTHYSIRSFTRESAIFTTGGTDYGVRLFGFGYAGALGKNVYIAIGKDANVPAFGKDVMYTPGAVEYALMACQHDGIGRTVSGQNVPITCKIGELHP